MKVRRVALRGLAAVALAAPVTAGAVLLAEGGRGFVEVAPSQVAVVADYRTGETRVVDAPGVHPLVPFLQRAWLLEKKSHVHRFLGDSYGGGLAPKLVVRARDGSMFWFEAVELQVGLRPEAADRALADAARPGTTIERWIAAHARGVLRDAFGDLVAQEVIDPLRAAEAKTRAVDELDALFAPHGLQVVQLVAPKPQFDRTYEKAIESRKVLETEADRLAAELEQVAVRRERRLEAERAGQEHALEELRATLVDRLAKAEAEEVAARAAADEYGLRRAEEGEASARQLEAEAEMRRASERAGLDALRAELAALAAHGPQAVREEVVRKLGAILFRVEPAPRAADEASRAVAAAGGGR